MELPNYKITYYHQQLFLMAYSAPIWDLYL
nr:MAG TPA: hypothetical protein [Caudoviricetes sp.]